MGDFLASIWWMIVSFSVLVTFHEFGHYWVARRCGVKVLRFSIGFGTPLWSHRSSSGTEFVIGAIPLGGYVKMLDEREADVTVAERNQAFNRKSVWQRIAIVAAGPLANLLLCMLLLWVLFVIGKQDYSATVGRAEHLAAQAGIHPGDRITAIDGRQVTSWSEASMLLTAAAMDRQNAVLSVIGPYGERSEHTLELSKLKQPFDERHVTALVGINWQFMLQPPIIAKIEPGSIAEGAIKPGDIVLAVDGQQTLSTEDLYNQIQKLGRDGHPGMIEIRRGEERLALELSPRKSAQGVWLLGVKTNPGPVPAFDSQQRYGVLAAVPLAIRETARMTADSLGMMKRIITGQASAKNISGPISIAKIANASAKRGVGWFIYFLSLLSLSLAIINLFPIPILDGGHLLYYAIELLKGSPLSTRAMAAGQYIGLALLAGLMGLAFYNDLLG